MERFLVNMFIRFLLNILLKLDVKQLKKCPKNGPYLLAVNHLNFLDAPVVISHLHPRQTTGLIKKESWDKPFLAYLFRVWDGIPIERDTADFKAFNQAKDALKDGKILAIAPEGTRSEDGVLIQAKPGIAILALKTNLPIYPIAYYGHEDFKQNFRRLKRTPMTVRVGEPIRVDLQGQPKNKENLQSVADSIMIEIASLMPEKYRGYYSTKMAQRGRFIEYLEVLPWKHIAQSLGEQPS